MSTPFQSALSAYIAAEREHDLAVHVGLDADAVGSCERALAQAGDSLESEVRRMIREEANAREARRAVHYVGPSD